MLRNLSPRFCLELHGANLWQGKVDRKALESIYEGSITNSDRVEMENVPDIAATILAISRRVLGSNIELDTPLRTAGMDSLRAIKLVSMLRSHFDSINLAMITTSNSVLSLAQNIEDSPTLNLDLKSSTTRAASILPNETTASLNLNSSRRYHTCTRQQIALLSETIHRPELHINTVILQLAQNIDWQTFRNAFQMVANGNEILKAGFVATEHASHPFVWYIDEENRFDRSFDLQHPLQLEYEAGSHMAKLTLHHAVYDGWSIDLVIRDINELLDGGDITKRPSFEAFAGEHDIEFSLHNDDDLLFWTSNLRSTTFTPLPLLTSSAKASPGAIATNQQCYILDVKNQELERASAKLRTSRATLTHTIISILFSELTGEEDVVIGSVFAGRDGYMADCAEVVGPCFSILPLPIHIDANSSFQDISSLVTNSYLRCLLHPHVTLSQLNNRLELPHGQQMFDVVFVWQESLGTSQKHDYVKIASHLDRLPYPLLIEVEPSGEDLSLIMTYDSTHLASDQVDCMAAQLNLILKRAITNPEAKVRDLWSSLPVELSSCVFDTAHPPATLDLFEELEEIAKDDPERVALETVEAFDPVSMTTRITSLTYRQLFHQARLVAQACVQYHRLRPDDLVMVMSHKCVDVYIVLTALLMSGVGYLCVDPDTPPARLDAMILETDPRLLILHPDLVKIVGQRTNIECLTLSNMVDANIQNLRFDERSFHDLSNEHLAYSISTSGSTGTPKVVHLSRGNLAANLSHLTDIYPHKASSRMLQSSSLSFDLSVFEIFWTLSCGMTLCTVSRDVLLLDVEALVNKLEITHLSMTPSVAALLQPENVPTVEFLICAGEPMTPKVFESWIDHG